MPNEKPDSFQIGTFEVARNPDVRQFVEKLNRLREAVDQCRLQDGVGYTVSRSTNGTTLSIKTGTSGGATGEIDHPFKVTTRTLNGQKQIRVLKESFLTWPDGGVKEIADLDKWIQAKNGDTVFLETRFSAGYQFTSAKILVTAQNLASFEDGAARIRVGSLTQSGALVQNVRFHVQAVNACRNGSPAIVFSWAM